MLQTGTQAIKETTLSSRQPKAVPASKTLRRCSAQPDTQGETQRGRPAEPRISTPAVHERRRQEGREGKERANPKGGEKNNETKRGGQRDSQTKIFFSSGMADHALRLGPYMRRSSLKEHLIYIDTCGHVGWQIKSTNKTQTQTTKGETQIPQPDMRFAIQQRNKAKSERGRAQQKQPQPRFAMDTVVKSHCVATHKKMHKRIGCYPEK